MAFTPRLTSSGIENNPIWYADNPFYQSGWGMPNCTCYAYGRWWEILGNQPTMLPLGDAGTWYDNAPSSIQKGNTPQLGAIEVMYDPYGYYMGHVAVVEHINANGDILTSNSAWNGTFFFTETEPLRYNYIPDWARNRGYRLKGFLYLPGSPVATEWIKGNRYLTQSEMDNNAYIVYWVLTSYGWTLNAIAGFLGNLWRESTVNPGIWENLTVDPANGYGLVQWTPSTKWTDYANAHGYAIDDGYRQLEYIDNIETGQYIPTSSYPETFAEFKTSTNTPEYLAAVFMFNYERAGVEALAERQYWARYYYNLLQDIPEPPPYNPGGEKRGLKPWQMIRYII